MANFKLVLGRRNDSGFELDPTDLPLLPYDWEAFLIGANIDFQINEQIQFVSEVGL